jgi:cytochrome P450
LPVGDPYPALSQLRDSAPVHWLEAQQAHLVVSHATANEVLPRPAWSSDVSCSPRLASRLGLDGTGSDFLTRSVLFADPPDHDRLRAAIRPWLAARTVESFRPRVSAIVRAALAHHCAGADLDVMDTVAYAVPLAVICELLAMPADLANLLREETPRLIAVLDPLAGPSEANASLAAAFSLLVEILPLVADRRTNPGSDLISALMAGTSVTTALAADEAVMMALMLLAAGHETTANLIGNAVIGLHGHPSMARLLRRHPDQLPAAVEEFLRYESPVQLASRTARRATDIAGFRVPSGGLVLVSIGAANRDPAVFRAPDRLDLGRRPGQHLAFGHGPHFCAGAALARLEAQEVLRHLLNLTPPIEERHISVTRGCSATFRRIDALVLVT